MRTEASILMRHIETSTTELLGLLEKLKLYMAENSTNTIELADIAFAAREVTTYLEEFKKRVNEIGRIAQATCCIVMAHTGEEIVRTDYCSASSNPKPWFRIPYKREQDPAQWDEIMRGINVGEPANSKDLVRIHAPSFMEYCGELIGEGKQPPAGINPKEMTAMELNLRITKKRK